MDRPTTGKRHVRSGSVHVTELIGKRIELPADIDDLVPHEPTSHRPPQSRAATMAKIAVLSVATATLCGAVAAATVITRDREAADASARPSNQITGERALLPDELNRAVAGARLPDPKTGSASATLNKGQDVGPAIPPARTGGTHSGAQGADRAASGDTPQRVPIPEQVRPKTTNRELVIEYYRLIESDPSRAYALLSSDVFTTTLGQFLGSWSRVSKVEVLEVVEQADGVVAVVRMHLIGGSQLRIKQLLTVGDTVPQRIIGAELLSAQLN
ncbi:hypothetical protein SAMN05192558_12252 [Actinokineospora alba]|uniref:Uncharacterized protein n=1 Tax=Actinokineospora alba TaxID=504798 RepID=A0A1H0WK00_9PSEU|nr:hypothetical protein [Actinokineospora alba]TDP65414.1 hypothetical protein C8E96_0896 [Actinokineospora alba]SDP90927.1 hypothetical protein SAMN05192558_12252 [Actinokineospora alba]